MKVIKQCGFTLLEVIVAGALLSMLAGMLFSAFHVVRKRAKFEACNVLIHNISLAVYAYGADYQGTCPPSHQRAWGSNDCTIGQGAGSQALASYLFPSQLREAVTPAGKPDYYLLPEHIGFKSVLFAGDRPDAILDPWGTPFFYYYPAGPDRGHKFDLFSAGPDKKTLTQIYNSSGTQIYDYRIDVPYVFSQSSRQMVPAGGPTGDPSDMGYNVIGSAQEVLLDDIVNW